MCEAHHVPPRNAISISLTTTTEADSNTESNLEFGHSGGVAEGVGDALAKGWRKFCGLDGLPGHDETLLGPDRPSYCGEAVREGRPLLVVPSAGRDLDPGTAVEARRQQGDDREQPEQAGRGAGDRLVRPLTLGLDAKVVTHLAEGDFELPALDESADDLQRLLRRVGAEQRLRIEAPAGIAQQHPADRYHRHAAVAPDGGVRADLHDAVALAVPANITVALGLPPPEVMAPRLAVHIWIWFELASLPGGAG